MIIDPLPSQLIFKAVAQGAPLSGAVSQVRYVSRKI